MIGAAILAVGYLGFTTARYVIHEYQLRQEQASLSREIDELAVEHEQLIAVRDYLKSDEYVEEVARQELGLVRPGETLVVVSSTAGSTPTPLPDEPSAGRAWWQRLFLSGPPTPEP